jgi:hypothetical protein
MGPPVGRLLLDAGVSFGLGPVRLDLPVWLNRPAPGEGPWKMRWRFVFVPGWSPF